VAKPANQNHGKLIAELAEMLEPCLPGIDISVGSDNRWNRPCVTFCWTGFEGLLPEERFQRLTAIIPEGFRDSEMKGFVWLELAPDETLETFLKLPRSEDVASREAAISAEICDAGFFEALGKALGKDPGRTCPGDFSNSAAVLAEKSFAPAEIRDAKLLFIAHGAYCDCQALQSVRPAIEKLRTGVA